MDPMIDFVRDRTHDLQRTADTIRRDREVRQSAAQPAPAPAEVRSPLAALVAPVLAADACDGVACAPADTRHAA